MNVYTFDPHDLSLGTEKKRYQKKRIYAASRTVAKIIVFIPAQSLGSDHTVALPSGSQIKKLEESRNVKTILCKRSWTSEEVRTNVQALAPSLFTDIAFLKPVYGQQKMKYLCLAKDPEMNALLSWFHQKYIYVLQV